MEPIIVPELDCPFPAAISPHAAAVEEHTLTWARRVGLVADEAIDRRLGAANVAGLAARIHPDAGPETLQLVSDWYAWMFFKDDQCDETGIGYYPQQLAALNAHFLEILRGVATPAADAALARALQDLRERLEALPAGTWMRGFIRSVRQYFQATVWEATNREAGITPDLETYIRKRPFTAGLGIDSEFMRIAEGTHLPPQVGRHSVVRSLTRASNNAVCWANDILSLEKEVKRGDVHNLVVVLQYTYGHGLQQAVDRAAEMFHHEVYRFASLESGIPTFSPDVDGNLARYVAVLRTRIRGNLDWARESGRYHVA